MCPVETCQANGSSPFNFPDMFLPVSRCLRPQCQRSCLTINGYRVKDHVYTTLILLALPPSFESIKTHFLDGLSNPTLLNPNTVTARIVEKDAHSQNEPTVNVVASPSKTGPPKKGKKKAKHNAKPIVIGEGKPPGLCFHCRKGDHWNKDCPKKKKKPDQSKPGGSSSLHVVENEDTSSDAESTLLCYLSLCEDWFMDSGATKHLSPHHSNSKSYQAYPESKVTYVMLGDSKTCLCVHSLGTIERWAGIPNSNKNSYCQLILMNVLHVPGISQHFLSLSTFDDKGFKLQIKDHVVTLAKGNTALIGHRVGKLYITPMFPPGSHCQTFW